MTVVTSGLDWNNEPCEFFLNENLKNNLDDIKQVVLHKDFDYVCIVAGLPGQGKSTLATSMAKYCDPNFSINNIAFTAEDFISKTETLPPHSSIILDESFASLNSKVSKSKDFLKIINHLQIIRQKNFFIFLCLPNFFDLSKGISIYRAAHLFVVYGEKFGDRGSFAAYDRELKKDLYIKGLKYMNYHVVKPNFRGTFSKQKAINEDEYRKLKLNHLKEQEKVEVEKSSKNLIQRDKLITYNKLILNTPINLLMEITDLSQKSIYLALEKHKEEINLIYGKEK